MSCRSVLPAFVLLCVAGTSFGQRVDAGYAVGTWQGFRPAAVSHTFDDNVRNQLAVAVPMFDAFGYRLTLFALTDETSSWAPPDWPGMQAAAAKGHEIASHSVSHARMNELPADRQAAELKDSRDTIEENIPGPSALTFAYPYCVSGDRSLVAAHYIAARGCQGNVERSTPLDLMNVSSIVVGSEGAVRTTADLISRARAALDTNGWTVFLFHGIDDDGGYSPIPSTAIRTYLEYVKAHDDAFWVETFGNVVRYLRERDAASVTEVSAGEDRIAVQVTDTLDDAIYDYPITIRRELPQGWAAASVTQNGEPVASRTAEVEGVKYVTFDVVPDGGAVVLLRSSGTGVKTGDATIPGMQDPVRAFPNPFRDTTRLVYRVGEAGPVKLEIYDVLGKRVKTLVDAVRPAGQHAVAWDASGCPAGTYVYRYALGSMSTSGLLTRTR